MGAGGRPRPGHHVLRPPDDPAARLLRPARGLGRTWRDAAGRGSRAGPRGRPRARPRAGPRARARVGGGGRAAAGGDGDRRGRRGPVRPGAVGGRHGRGHLAGVRLRGRGEGARRRRRARHPACLLGLGSGHGARRDGSVELAEDRPGRRRPSGPGGRPRVLAPRPARAGGCRRVLRQRRPRRGLHRLLRHLQRGRGGRAVEQARRVRARRREPRAR
ncbi:hypothetical protein NOCARDAX2BIS_50068 [Nocardioides sp. AX2bis]|nr:hypothetical protein NOCARDAX2BIS_50068 [Nocardioides sp. AX2bis]